ncbi:hypothetical protein LX81_02625 [Palleronia aestuarii]|uniref:Uncharacterized protein n=1 Tax=Palleronia aestuarii TaxID=568105 RepID=A0A2W7NAD1_9RHOB|nr:hypothetical protein [Palleronia aestuarii]PZX15037.1 hypothetical protein LX81_02625 [Palleronia aestuarii]
MDIRAGAAIIEEEGEPHMYILVLLILLGLLGVTVVGYLSSGR